MRVTRREFIRAAVAVGATAAWGRAEAAPSRIAWHERRDLYTEGVASGDPDAHSVLLWTRRDAGRPERLTVEVAQDKEFQRVVAVARAPVSAESDWTCRVLVGGLQPATEYWYRFTDRMGNGS